MADRTLTEEDGKQALQDHIMDKAIAMRNACDGHVNVPHLLALLEDRRYVRFPVSVSFDASPLQDGEFAYLQPLGETAASGFQLFIHPYFESRTDDLPMLIAYYLVCVNYGDIASHLDAELFGSTLCGMSVEDYYQALCKLADELSHCA